MVLSSSLYNMEIHTLKKIVDDRGMVLHMMKKTSPWFEEFGEVYFSVVNPGVIKGWKYHKKMTQHFVVPSGEMKLVFFDNRDESPTKGHFQEVTLSLDNYKLIKVPPQIWYAFKATSPTPALMVNCASIPHDPEESLTLPLTNDLIPYQW